MQNVLGGEPTVAVVVGVGSIGRRHARRLADRCDRLIVVDPSPEARRWAEESLPVPVVAEATLEPALEAARLEATSAIGVIANWGPDHAATFHAMVDAGFKRILCEKPMAHSPYAAWQMARRAEREGVRVTFGMYLRYSGVPRFLTDQLGSRGGGAPVMLAVHGGAQGLVTNGIHFLDLACALFDAEPESVWAEAVDDRINPRSPDLGFWAGVASWAFSGGRSAAIAFSNASSVSSAMHVYGPTGRIDLASPTSSDGAITVGSRDPLEIARDPRVTRVGDLVTLTTFARGFAPVRDPIEQQYDELLGSGPSTYPPSRAAAVLEAMLAALASSAQGRRVSLPLASDDPFYGQTWPVS